MEQNENKSPLAQAALIFGSEAALARALGVSRGALNQWKKPGREVPAEHAPRIELLTGVCCELLCPSIDWALVRKPRPGAICAASQFKTPANPHA